MTTTTARAVDPAGTTRDVVQWMLLEMLSPAPSCRDEPTRASAADARVLRHWRTANYRLWVTSVCQCLGTVIVFKKNCANFGLLQFGHTSTDFDNFYPRDAMLARCLPSSCVRPSVRWSVCLSVCLSQVGVLLRWLKPRITNTIAQRL